VIGPSDPEAQHPCLAHNCTACCFETRLSLLDEDIVRLVAAGHHGFAVADEQGYLRLRNVGGRCVFLGPHGCSVYSIRPDGCLTYPLVYFEDDGDVDFDPFCPHTREFGFGAGTPLRVLRSIRIDDGQALLRRRAGQDILTAMAEMIEGTVIAMHGALVRVQAGDRCLVVAARRKLKWLEPAPVAKRLVVGDRVTVRMEGEDGVVETVHPRRTALLRRAPQSSRPQLIAANVDQALVVFAARNPQPKRGLLDRFLVACHHAGIEALIVINKADQGLDGVKAWLQVYRSLAYPVLTVSARTGRSMGQIKRALPGRTTLFCGPSGAGKSSLLNAVYPGFRLKVGSLSEATGKGKHTTTMAELLPLPFGGFVVDTPGLKELGLWNLDRRELEAAFPEIADRAGACRFADCTHVHEPGCAVLAAVAAGEIDPARHASYAGFLQEE